MTPTPESRAELIARSIEYLKRWNPKAAEKVAKKHTPRTPKPAK